MVAGDEQPDAQPVEDHQKSDYKSWLKTLFRRQMRIELKDGRILQGSFECLDFKMNIILQRTCQINTGISKNKRSHLGSVMIPGRLISKIETLAELKE